MTKAGRRLVRSTLWFAAFVAVTFVLHDLYSRIFFASKPPTSDHIASQMPRGEWWWQECRSARYRHRTVIYPKSDEVKCHPLLTKAFVDAEVWPPEPRPGFRCGKTASCPIEWVTFATHCTQGLNRLAISAHRAGIPFTILGHGMGWIGWGYRLRLFHDYLLTVPDDRVVLFTDSDDVILAPACTASDIISGYRAFDTPIVFSGEVACWPRGDLAANYTNLPTWKDWSITHFHFLNAGLSIGTAGMRKALLRKMYIHDCYDDQSTYAYAYLSDLSYYHDKDNSLQLADRFPLALFEPKAFSMAEFHPPPASAKPIIALDMMSDLFISMYATFFDFFTFPDDSGHTPTLGSPNSHGHGGRKGFGTAKHIGGSTQPGTGGTPCLFHQQGNKSENHVLELMARKWGMIYNADELTEDELRRWNN